MMRVLVFSAVLVALCMLNPHVAVADKVDMHANQLKRGKNYKLRLSAAINLARTRDPRAVGALIYALAADSEGTVRRVAALSLGKMIDSSMGKSTRKRAIKALKKAAKGDKDKLVRQNAANALKRITKISSSSGTKGRLFLAVGLPADLTKKTPRGTEKAMHNAVTKMLKKHAPQYPRGTKTAQLPTKAELKKNKMRGYYIGSTIAMMNVSKTGSSAKIKCSVSVRISPWSGRDGHEKLVANKSASATGNGSVIGSSTSRGIRASKRECVLAVIEEVTARQVVPFLRRVANN